MLKSWAQKLKRDISLLLETSEKTDDYTLAAADQGKIVQMNKGSAGTVIVPPRSTVPFPIGAEVGVYNRAADPVSIEGADGVVVRNASPLAQYGEVKLRKRAEDEWVIRGGG